MSVRPTRAEGCDTGSQEKSVTKKKRKLTEVGCAEIMEMLATGRIRNSLERRSIHTNRSLHSRPEIARWCSSGFEAHRRTNQEKNMPMVKGVERLLESALERLSARESGRACQTVTSEFACTGEKSQHIEPACWPRGGTCARRNLPTGGQI